jgi:hypothetical protein
MLPLAVNVVPRSNALVATSRVAPESILTSADDVIFPPPETESRPVTW